MQKTKRLTVLAMLAAVAFALAFFSHFLPAVGGNFLKYDPKPVIVTVAGFLYGPLAAFTVSAAVAVLELFTVSDTGWIGLIMNILTTAGFACTASLIYSRHRRIGGAAVGLGIATAVTTALMLLWNYLVTPLYMHVPREVVAAMLPTVFLPFNLLQGVANTALTLMLYRPLTTALRAAKLLPPSSGLPKSRKTTLLVTLGGAFLLASAVLAVLFWNDIL